MKAAALQIIRSAQRESELIPHHDNWHPLDGLPAPELVPAHRPAPSRGLQGLAEITDGPVRAVDAAWLLAALPIRLGRSTVAGCVRQRTAAMARRRNQPSAATAQRAGNFAHGSSASLAGGDRSFCASCNQWPCIVPVILISTRLRAACTNRRGACAISIAKDWMQSPADCVGKKCRCSNGARDRKGLG